MPKRDMVNELSIASARMKLRIDKNSLDDEVIKQPELYFECAEAAGLAQSRRVGAKDELERLEARLYKVVAAKLVEEQERVTENAVHGRVINHKSRIEAFEKLQQALIEEKTWEALKDAAQQRSYALKDLCNLTSSGFLGAQSMNGQPSRRVQELAYDKNKAEMRKKRKKITA